MNTAFRVLFFLMFGALLVGSNGIFRIRYGLEIDFAWLLVVASAFACPLELAPYAGILFGLILDGLTGSSFLIYTISYGGFGILVSIIKRAFFLKGFIPGWIVAVVGSELLWLFMLLYGNAILFLGGSARPLGWLSPFLMSSFLFYPLCMLIANWILKQPADTSHEGYFSGTSRASRT